MAPRSAPDAHPVVHLYRTPLGRGPHAYAREVDDEAGGPEDGSIVEVRDELDRFQGHALYNRASDIRLRWLSRGRRTDLDRPGEFLLRRIAAADRLRRKGLRLEETGSAWRVVHAEGDGLGGLIIDRLGGVLVCEYHALGFWYLRAEVEAALGQLYPGLPVVHKVARLARRHEDFPDAEPDVLTSTGAAPEDLATELVEHELVHGVVPGVGHKTGWFCDQRDNRLRVAQLARGREVLDLCCNAGGFALQAARLGARRVTAVDLDEAVVARAAASAARNGLSVDFVHADAYPFLRDVLAGREKISPSVVVCDPHKVVASKRDLEAGLVKYGDLNALALQVVRPGGFLATFSCSGPVDLPTFLGVVFKAARRAEREVRLLELFGAGPDHPQVPDYPRSRYLKGALLAVD